jgi:hypothetical protein
MLAQMTVPFYFGALVGVGSGTLRVTATATRAPALATEPAPIGVQAPMPYTEGTATTLVFWPNSGSGIPEGTWSALSLGSTFTSVFPGQYSVAESIGASVAGDRTASVAGPLAEAIQERIDLGVESDPSGNYANYTSGDPRAITIVLGNWSVWSMTIVNFAELWLDGVDGRTATVSGHWISQNVPGAADTTGTVPNDGALAISLTN